MAGEYKATVVGNSFDGTTGSITVELPVDQLSQFTKGLNLPSGKAIARDLGQRYGLRTESQVLSVPDDRDAQIDLAKDLYKSEPIVANVIDLMIDLCLTGMENRSEDANAKEFFDNFCKYADFDSLHRQILQEYLIVGDVFILRGPRTKVDFGPDQGFEYFTYSVMNPRYVEVMGSLVFGSEFIGITPTDELKKAIQDDSPEMRRVIRKLPNELRRAVENDEAWVPKEELVSRISRKRASYERYATPYLSRIFEPVLIKRRMREADLALAETVRTVLVTFTLGSDEFPAKQNELDALDEALSTPTKSTELIWNHTLKVDYHYPDASLFGDEKYNQVNQDIKEGLGLPSLLVDGGGGGSFAAAWTSLLAVIERLDSIRDQIKRWQEQEYRRIAKTTKQNFKAIPSVEFKPLNLRDDKVFKNLLLELYDRGLLSMETLMSFTDVDFDTELRNREAEQSAGVDEIMVPRSSKNDGGRPSDKVDPGNYTDRDKTPDIEDDSPESDPSTEK